MTAASSSGNRAQTLASLDRVSPKEERNMTGGT